MLTKVGNKSAGRSVLLRFFLYPAVENIPGGIIFYRGLKTSHTRALRIGKSLFSQPELTNFWKLTFPYR
jgi:hypothetical protein